MKTRIFQVDAFTDKPFRGNPAGVCLLEDPQSDSWMQDIAMEMNLSETAFLLKIKEGFSLRWFTPKTEVSLCGHATLASAHILWEEGILRLEEEAIFLTKSGKLVASNKDNGIEMDFPSMSVQDADAPNSLIGALKIKPSYIGRYLCSSGASYLIEVESEDVVKNMNPDFGKLRFEDAKAIIVTSISESSDYDFISRFFAPALGIDEDPVTGSAHCCLAPYWAPKLQKNELVGYQASKRSGVVHCRVSGNRVFLKGKAITIFKGELNIQAKLDS